MIQLGVKKLLSVNIICYYIRILRYVIRKYQNQDVLNEVVAL